jgi:hypothetical protein
MVSGFQVDQEKLELMVAVVPAQVAAAAAVVKLALYFVTMALEMAAAAAVAAAKVVLVAPVDMAAVLRLGCMLVQMV